MGNGTGSDDDRRYVCHACQQRHDNARIVCLPDGTTVGLQSREYTLYCEAKTVLSWPLKKRREYLEQVEKARGIAGKEELQDALKKWHGQVGKVSAGSRKP